MKSFARLFSIFLLSLASLPALGEGTTIWETSTRADFNAGTLQGVVVFSPGGVRLGPKLNRIELEEGAVWCLLHVPGRGLFAGTARGASVYCITDGKAERVLETEDLLISSLVADGEGNLYAASVPGGKIHRIPPEGDPLVIRVPDPYVWAMTLDHLGNVLAATGPKGKLYRVEKGTGWVKEVFASDKEKNLVSLAVGGSGEVYCGSAENGILYRIQPDGKVETVYDFKEREVRAISLSEDGVYVGLNTPKKGFDQVSFVGGISGTLSSEAWGGGSRQDVMKKILGASLYRIDIEGRVEEMANFPKTFLMSMGVGEKGEIFVATGDSGRVFTVDRKRLVTTVVDLAEEQVLCLAMDGSFPAALGSGAPGVLYTVKAPRGSKGRYVSKIHDALFPASWGQVTWGGEGKFTLAFRSGNTEKPDRTWSPWSVAVHSPGRPVPSPPGRYLQYRIDFEGDVKASVHRVRVAYLVQNQRPVIKELKIGDSPGGEKFPQFPGKRQTVLKLLAKAEDPNGDKLVFRFFYRREGDEGWIPVSKEPLEKPEFQWNTEDLPDGLYQIRVVASDERSNPSPLTQELVSRPLPVDNHRPRIEGLTVVDGKVPRVRGVALDMGSVVARLEYRIDGGSWFPIAPMDGVLDSRREAFSFSIPGLEGGLHRLWVRGFDRAGNTGVVMVEFRVS